MKALIIGGAGFVGKYLIQELNLKKNSEVFATKLEFEEIDEKNCDVYDLDILKQEDIEKLLDEIKPDAIFHLAAQSSVALSWKSPALTVDVNIKGAVNLLEAVRKLDYKPKLLLIGSGEEYGAAKESDMPIKETFPPNPQNVYAITKNTQNQIGTLYAKAYGMDIILIRAFNHIGPGQSPQFVVPDFCKQVAETEKGFREPVIKVGNLSAKRDFTDVRDIVRAYVMLAEKGKSGETYNVGSGKAVQISNILDEILKLTEAEIKVETDRDKFRPVDAPVIKADISKLKTATGWEPLISINQTLKDTYNCYLNLIMEKNENI